MPSYDAIVIGAGAIGAATAYHLARSGRSVCVVDARGVASGATGAAEGSSAAWPSARRAPSPRS